jgi:hypothetical protein
LPDGIRFGKSGELISKFHDWDAFVHVMFSSRYHLIKAPGKVVSTSSRETLAPDTAVCNDQQLAPLLVKDRLDMYDDKGRITDAVYELLRAGEDDTTFVEMLLDFVEKYGEWECTPTAKHASVLGKDLVS